MKRPPVEFSWDWCEQKKYCGFSSKNWYLLLVSVRAWFSSKISDDYPRTPVTFMWEYSTPPFPGVRITHNAACEKILKLGMQINKSFNHVSR